MEWLRRDLAAAGRRRPLVLYQHYPFLGPYSRNTPFVLDGHRERFDAALAGYNVVALFHGHYHATGWYRWRGREVIALGSPKGGWKSFAVVRITDARLTVAAWNYEVGRWWWWRDAPLPSAVAAAAQEIVGQDDLGLEDYRPLIPFPGSEPSAPTVRAATPSGTPGP
jgi:hypothetical protein